MGHSADLLLARLFHTSTRLPRLPIQFNPVEQRFNMGNLRCLPPGQNYFRSWPCASTILIITYGIWFAGLAISNSSGTIFGLISRLRAQSILLEMVKLWRSLDLGNAGRKHDRAKQNEGILWLEAGGVSMRKQADFLDVGISGWYSQPSRRPHDQVGACRITCTYLAPGCKNRGLLQIHLLRRTCKKTFMKKQFLYKRNFEYSAF